MHLSHFRHVNLLSLHDFHFQTFWDLRRFIIALPVLSRLDLSRVTWPRFYDDLSRLPSLAFTASRLQSITCWYGSAAEEILWVWVTTRKLPSSEHNSVVGYQIKDQYPAITIGDAAVIGKFIAQIAGLDWIMSMSWEPSREGQRCVSLLLSLDMLSLGRI